MPEAASTDGRAVIHLVAGQAFKGSFPDGLNFVCGGCGERLVENVAHGQVSDIVIECPACGRLNDVAGTDEPMPDVALSTGNYNFGEDFVRIGFKTIRALTDAEIEVRLERRRRSGQP